MGRIRQSFCMMSNIFREERRDKRVIMGFILGVALFGYWMFFFLRYVQETGEPVNVLETFIVIGHHYKNMLFLVLGWLLVIADAPFIKGNIYFILYRSSRKSWNLGMLFYIMLQAFLFTACIALVSVAVSSIWGFWGAMWSSPVYHLAMDRTNQLGVKYNITFPWETVMQSMAAPQAFALTFLFLWLYFVFNAAGWVWRRFPDGKGNAGIFHRRSRRGMEVSVAVRGFDNVFGAGFPVAGRARGF